MERCLSDGGDRQKTRQLDCQAEYCSSINGGTEERREIKNIYERRTQKRQVSTTHEKKERRRNKTDARRKIRDMRERRLQSKPTGVTSDGGKLKAPRFSETRDEGVYTLSSQNNFVCASTHAGTNTPMYGEVLR